MNILNNLNLCKLCLNPPFLSCHNFAHTSRLDIPSIKKCMIDIADISDVDDVAHTSSPSPSATDVNVGGGVEMLMNHASMRPKRDSSPGGGMHDVDAEFDSMISAHGDGGGAGIDLDTVKFTDDIDVGTSGLDSFVEGGRKRARTNVGESTVGANVDRLGADGYGRMSDMPPPCIGSNQASSGNGGGDDEDDETLMDPRTLHRKKLYYIEKIKECERKGAELSFEPTQDEKLYVLKNQLASIRNRRSEKLSIQFQRNALTALIQGVEWVNGTFDPFKCNFNYLEGWSDQIDENIEDFDECFESFNESYASLISASPEFKFCVLLAGSGAYIASTNAAVYSKMCREEHMNTPSQASYEARIPYPNVPTNPAQAAYARHNSGRYAPSASTGSGDSRAALMSMNDGRAFADNASTPAPAPAPRAEMRGPSDISAMFPEGVPTRRGANVGVDMDMGSTVHFSSHPPQTDELESAVALDIDCDDARTMEQFATEMRQLSAQHTEGDELISAAVSNAGSSASMADIHRLSSANAKALGKNSKKRGRTKNNADIMSM